MTLRYFISFGGVEHQPVILSLLFYCCIIILLLQYLTLCLRKEGENGCVEKKLLIPFAAEKGILYCLVKPNLGT